ncbi:MAG: glycosyltransferase family 9 protein [Microscillaceae bacterium]|nr:glycosyltransferase family 9 protein [Microscillaceae bacterium]MDW8460814.1 glycosyltransferase family 9 protein [Cytophagales bacterium]
MKTKNLTIILSRTDNIGDVVLTLPMAGYLKSRIEGVKIGFIGKAYTRPLIESSIFVDIFLDREEILQNPYLLAKLSAEVIIFVFPDKPLAQLAKRLHIPMRIGTSHRWFHWLYANKLVHLSRRNSHLHESQLNFKLLAPLGLKEELALNQIYQYYGIKPNFNQLTELEKLIHSNKFNLIMHPKSRGSAREWSLEKYYELAQKLPASQFHIFITGIASEGKQIREAKPEIFTLTNVTDLTGKLSLAELINFIYLADGLLSCSTGPLHIAAAFNKMALGLYPPIKPMHVGRWGPVGKYGLGLTSEKNCNLCRNKKHCACIESIEVEKVRQIIQQYAKNYYYIGN